MNSTTTEPKQSGDLETTHVSNAVKDRIRLVNVLELRGSIVLLVIFPR
jgi:hypothetical protein